MMKNKRESSGMEKVYNYENDNGHIATGWGITFNEIFLEAPRNLVKSDLVVAGPNEKDTKSYVYPASYLRYRTDLFNEKSALISKFMNELDHNLLTAPSAEIQIKRNQQRMDALRAGHQGAPEHAPEIDDIVRRRQCVLQFEMDYKDITHQLEILCDMFSLEELQDAIQIDEEYLKSKGHSAEEAYGVAVFILFFSYPVQFRLCSGYLTVKYIKHLKALLDDEFNAETPFREKTVVDEYNMPYLVPRKLCVEINSMYISDSTKKSLIKRGFEQRGMNLCKKGCSGDDVRDIRIALGRKAVFYTYPEYNFGETPLAQILKKRKVTVGYAFTSDTEMINQSSSEETHNDEELHSGLSDISKSMVQVDEVEEKKAKKREQKKKEKDVYKPKTKGAKIAKSVFFYLLMIPYIYFAFYLDLWVFNEVVIQEKGHWIISLVVFLLSLLGLGLLDVYAKEDWKKEKEEKERIKKENREKAQREAEEAVRIEKERMERGFGGDDF